MITNLSDFVEIAIVKNRDGQERRCIKTNKKPPEGGVINDFRDLFFRLGFGKTFVEFVDTAIGCRSALFAGVERMAIRASFNFDFLQGRTGFEGVPTANAGDGAFVVLGMDVFFHFLYSFRLAKSIAKRDTGDILPYQKAFGKRFRKVVKYSFGFMKIDASVRFLFFFIGELLFLLFSK